MEPEIKTKWVAALRSGEYEQGKESLKTHDGKFCCLGVLCDIHSKETGNEWVVDVTRNTSPLYLSNGGILPEAVRDWANLGECHPEVKPPGSLEFIGLAQLNDNEGYTFDKIADVIEATL